MSYLYHTIIYKPLLNALFFLYNTVALQDLGLAIVLLTVLIRLVLFPIFQKSVRHQMVMQKLQPKIKKIQEDHRGDAEKQTKAMMELYREHRVNPLSGFGLLLVQLPVLIALYQIFLNSLSLEKLVGDLYSFVPVPLVLHTTFFGLINLGNSSILIVGLTAIAQYFQARLSVAPRKPSEAEGAAEKMAKRMALIGPVLTIVIFSSLPAALTLYWFVTSVFSIFQQAVVNKQLFHGDSRDIREENN